MTATKLEYITRCRVPGCNKPFVSDALDIPIIGQPNDRVIKFVTALMDHLQKKHPQIMMQVSAAIQEYMGFLVCSMFELADPKLLDMRERIRAGIAQASRRYQISDADIQARLETLELEPEDEEGLGILLRDFRDLLTEQGKYALTLPAQTDTPMIKPA